MTISRKHCSLCKKSMETRVMTPLSGEQQSYRISVENVPVMECPEAHKRFLYPDFAMKLLDAIVSSEASGIRAGKRHGLFRKRTSCVQCAADVAESKTAKEYRFNVRVPDIDEPIGIVLGAPVMRCDQCGTEQLADESEMMILFEALARAFKSGGIRPE